MPARAGPPAVCVADCRASGPCGACCADGDEVGGLAARSLPDGAPSAGLQQGARLDLARALVRAGRWREALKLYRAAEVSGDLRGQPLAWLGYAAALVDGGDAPAAERALEAALLLEPGPQARPPVVRAPGSLRLRAAGDSVTEALDVKHA